MSDQYDDHIWLTVNGEGWAIHFIERRPDGFIKFGLWRGYHPHLECCIVTADNVDWDGYCKAAVSILNKDSNEHPVKSTIVELGEED